MFASHQIQHSEDAPGQAQMGYGSAADLNMAPATGNLVAAAIARRNAARDTSYVVTGGVLGDNIASDPATLAGIHARQVEPAQLPADMLTGAPAMFDPLIHNRSALSVTVSGGMFEQATRSRRQVPTRKLAYKGGCLACGGCCGGCLDCGGSCGGCIRCRSRCGPKRGC